LVSWEIGILSPEFRQTGKPAGVEAFSFGEPVPVLDEREILDYIECYALSKWYETPVSFDGLAKFFRSATHQSSPVGGRVSAA
jgi:capsid portal protein